MLNYSSIPPPLGETGSFCCWRHENKNGRKTKIPYNPVTDQRAQANNPRTFVDFESACQMAHNYDGIGFLITDGLFIIDCDHCRNQDGTLTQTAAEITAMFNGTYMEWSPSGHGLHIIGSAAGFDVARFVPERKLWYCFDGKRWVPDLVALRVMEFCKQLADDLLSHAAGIEDEKKRSAYMAYCLKWHRRVFREIVLKEAQSIYPIMMEDFDTNIYAFDAVS